MPFSKYCSFCKIDRTEVSKFGFSWKRDFIFELQFLQEFYRIYVVEVSDLILEKR